MTFLGEIRPSRRRLPEGYRVERETTGFAYARNGNAHNPTPRFIWKAYRGTVLIGFSATEAGAVDIVSFDAKD